MTAEDVKQTLPSREPNQRCRMSARNATREFLFTYRFDGAEWGTSVFATDPAQAREKVKAMALARYDGELAMRIPAGIPGAGLFTRALTRWRNQRSGNAA